MIDRILYIGGFYPRKMIKTIADDCYGKVGFSNHNFEMSILEGLCHHHSFKRINLSVLCVPKVYSYPHNNKKIFYRSDDYDVKNASVHSISIFNLLLINKIWITISIFYNVVKFLWKNNDRKISILVNTPNVYVELGLILGTLFTTKKITKGLIIPDIPQMVTNMYGGGSLIKRLLVSMLDKFSLYLASKFDKFIFLTDAMKDFFTKPVDYIVMEGVARVSNSELLPFVMDDCKSILYTGSLAKIFGVRNLVDAFIKANVPNSELWICGSGDSVNYIRELSKKNTNIRYFGLITSEESFRLQRMATILVNPRTSEGEYTKYSFPSKTIEYMLAGKPVIINRLPGIPSEYYNYVYTPKTESVDDLSATIKFVFSLSQDELVRKGNEARKFIINNKNAIIQTNRIIEHLSTN